MKVSLIFGHSPDPLIEPQFWKKNTVPSKMKVSVLIFGFVALGSGFKIVTKNSQLIKMGKNNQCGPDQASCPEGCCPEPDWVCCPDTSWALCAETAADCPFEAKRTQLVNLSKSNPCGPDETNCPVGCCPMGPDWYCCPDHFPICAPTAWDCP